MQQRWSGSKEGWAHGEARGGTKLARRRVTAAGGPERWQQRRSQDREQVQSWVENRFGLRHGERGQGGTFKFRRDVGRARADVT